MKKKHLFVIVLFLSFFCLACGKINTPDWVMDSYNELQEEIKDAALVERLEKLTKFYKSNEPYKISDEVALIIADLSKQLDEYPDTIIAEAKAGNKEQVEAMLAELERDMPQYDAPALTCKSHLHLAQYFFAKKNWRDAGRSQVKAEANCSDEQDKANYVAFSTKFDKAYREHIAELSGTTSISNGGRWKTKNKKTKEKHVFVPVISPEIEKLMK